jgi:hypothetical protein
MAADDSPRRLREKAVTQDMLSKARAPRLEAASHRGSAHQPANKLAVFCGRTARDGTMRRVAYQLARLLRHCLGLDDVTPSPHRCEGLRCARSHALPCGQLLEHSTDLYMFGNTEATEFESASVQRLLGYSQVGCVARQGTRSTILRSLSALRTQPCEVADRSSR